MGQFDDAARFVPHRRYVAHFGACDQSLIFGVIPGDGVEQVNVFRRRQPLNVEVAEAPQVQPLGHHRMQSSIELFLLVGVLAGPVGEVLHAARTLSVARTSHFHHDAPNRTWKARLIDH